jgi:hypothetical protein
MFNCNPTEGMSRHIGPISCETRYLQPFPSPCPLSRLDRPGTHDAGGGWS